MNPCPGPEGKTDRSLLEDYRDGAPEAFGAIWDRHAEQVYSTAIGFGLTAHDSEDIVQDVFTKFWRIAVPERITCAGYCVWPFLKSLTYYAVMRFREKHGDTRVSDERLRRAVERDQSITQHNQAQRQLESFLAELRAVLPERLREFLDAFWDADCSIAGTARNLRCSTARAHRMLEDLRARMGGEFGD